MLDTTQETIPDDNERAAGNTAGSGPSRRCIATGASKSSDEMVRFAVSPDGEIVPDIKGILPGRGIWVTADRAAIETACNKGLFSRAARGRVSTDPALPDRVEALLAQRCLDLLGLARRGGGAVAGFDKVRAFLSAGEAGLLLAAADGAEDGRAKLARLGRDVPIVEVFSRAELGRAFGREQAVHVAVAPGKIARGIRAEARRLSGFRQRTAERGA
ncbi:MAG: RNA-binding protein [Alphaproteobacteria bacterium]|nr:RNA-binding protein [Alphaproteobacteria bacterium]